MFECYYVHYAILNGLTISDIHNNPWNVLAGREPIPQWNYKTNLALSYKNL